MRNSLTTSLKAITLFTVLCGGMYPLFLTALAQFVVPSKANGSLVMRSGQYIGSDLIGQEFDSDRYFWPRPSSIDYQPLPSGGSNQGPTSERLRKAVEERRRAFVEHNFLSPDTDVPSEMLFASGSGLDPDISVASAELQCNRVATARGFDEKEVSDVHSLIVLLSEPPLIDILGQRVVNVLRLNLAVDAMSQKKESSHKFEVFR